MRYFSIQALGEEGRSADDLLSVPVFLGSKIAVWGVKVDSRWNEFLPYNRDWVQK